MVGEGRANRALQGWRGSLGQGQPCTPSSPPRAPRGDGAGGPGEGLEPGAAPACIPKYGGAHHPLRPVPRMRVAAVGEQGWTSLPEVSCDAPQLCDVATERRGRLSVGPAADG